MTDQSVFATPDQQSVTPDATPDAMLNALNDQLKGIKNEDGNQKYADPAKAMEALANSQTYIPELQVKMAQMEADNTALKEQLAKSEAVEDVVSRLTKANEDVKPEATPQTPGLDKAAVADLFNQFSSDKAAQDAADANEQIVSKALTEAYGDKVSDVIEATAKTMGTTPEALQKIARENPKLVLQAFNQSNVPSQPTNGSFNIPPTLVKQDNELAPPTKSLLLGATTKDLTDYWEKITAKVYKDNDITG